MNGKFNNRIMVYFLCILQLFIGLTAVAGGYRLVSNPNGIPEFPLEWLSNSPFNTYFIPGLILLMIIGCGSTLTGLISFFRRAYSGFISVLSGASLIIYIGVEVWFIGIRNFLQPLYFILGIIVLILGLMLFKTGSAISSKEIKSNLDKLPA